MKNVNSIFKYIHAKEFSGNFCGQVHAENFGEDNQVTCSKCKWNIYDKKVRKLHQE